MSNSTTAQNLSRKQLAARVAGLERVVDLHHSLMECAGAASSASFDMLRERAPSFRELSLAERQRRAEAAADALELRQEAVLHQFPTWFGRRAVSNWAVNRWVR